ncbi:MAG: Zn-dependent exopeptidase M28 [Eubacteriaceae bacterium]|nr:Zn-dependent exopeptidase M28 [Eubacteriaceae bacterium]
MDTKYVKKILKDTAYVRTGGSREEKKCAEYLAKRCEDLGARAWIEEFPVQAAKDLACTLKADGTQISCLGYRNCGSWDVEAKLYYMPDADRYSLSEAKGKIVLIDTGMTHDMFGDLYEAGAKGIITYSGDANNPSDTGIDQKELRGYVCEGKKLPCVHIHTRDAVKLIEKGAKKVSISISQEEYEENSRNVVAYLKGKRKESIVLSAHYDSTSLSLGSYDNMSGCIGLLGILDELKDEKILYSLYFVFCGSEERGLLGSQAYCAAHEKELEDVVLNINLDMIGTHMGGFLACVTAEEALVDYIRYFGAIEGFGLKAKQGVYSSDSTSFADRGVPALSFARLADNTVAPIHNVFDTLVVLSPGRILTDTAFIAKFAGTMAMAGTCPVSRTIPDSMKEEMDYRLGRKRRPEK